MAVCDGNTATTAMVHESNIGVLQYSSGNSICATSPITTVMRDAGWGPRALATRLARLLTPTTLQAAIVRTGSGGTVTTVKSKFKTRPVETVKLAFDPNFTPPKTLFISKMPYVVKVRATTLVDGVETGVNGTCIYLTGTNNNGQNTALSGNHECDNEPPGSVSVITKSINVGNNVISSGYAEFALSVTKTGGLSIRGSSVDATGKSGVIERDGQTFVNTAIVKTNIKP